MYSASRDALITIILKTFTQMELSLFVFICVYMHVQIRWLKVKMLTNNKRNRAGEYIKFFKITFSDKLSLDSIIYIKFVFDNLNKH